MKIFQSKPDLHQEGGRKLLFVKDWRELSFVYQ